MVYKYHYVRRDFKAYNLILMFILTLQMYYIMESFVFYCLVCLYEP